MSNWDDFQPEDEHAKWSKFSPKRKAAHNSVINFLSAFIFTLAAVVVVTGNII